MEETNPAIILKEDFYAVQERLKHEGSKQKKDEPDCPLRRKIMCSCGHYYKRKVINSKTYWVCRKHDYDTNQCNSGSVPEKEIYNAFVNMVMKLRIYSKTIIFDTIEQMERLYSKSSGAAEKIREIDRSIAELTNKNLVLARLNSKGIMRAAEYTEKSGKLNAQISNLRAERRKLLQNDEDGCLSGLRQLEEIIQGMIANGLTEDGILTPRKTTQWTGGVIKSILTNEKYKGDALLQKTFIVDCISKKAKKNNGELPMYYVENSHPAIIERSIFDRVQAEMARRSSKRKTKEVGTKTELGKYSGKYALSEILYCGECGKPYRRVTWNIRGNRKIMWRCVSRLDYGKKYCKCSPSIEETILHGAIAETITRKAQIEGASTDRILQHIEMYQAQQDTSSILAKQERLRDLQKKFDDLTSIDIEQADTGEFDEQFESLMTEIHTIEDELSEMATIIDGLKNHPVRYDDLVTRQLIHYIKVVSKDKLQIYFKDGTIIDADI